MNVEMKFLFKHNVPYFIRLVLELKIVKIVKHYVINFEKKIFYQKLGTLCKKNLKTYREYHLHRFT